MARDNTDTMQSATVYTSIEGAALGRRMCLLGVTLLALLSAAASAAYVMSSGVLSPSDDLEVAEIVQTAAIVHTGKWCTGAGAKTYTKTTVKTIVDRTIAGLLTYGAGEGESKFEASDVIRVGEYFISVCDSSWSILNVSESLPLLSHENRLIHPDASFVPPDDEDSGFEALMHDRSGDAKDFYIVRESVAHERLSGDYYAQILKARIDGATYHVEENCHTELRFEGPSKGLEGATSLRGADGVLYILGLCEGNFCSKSRGKKVGNGRIVVMAREDKPDDPDGCWWRTVRTLELPRSVSFIDYSALSVHHSTQAIAVTSQQNSQLWVGKLEGGSDGVFDPSTAAFTEGKVYDFPRTGACEVQYCNIEGVHWLSGSRDDPKNAVPQMLVAVSDKMKKKGKQAVSCFEKDQSMHIFALP